MCKGVIMMQILSFIDKICQNRGAGSATGKPNFQFLQDMLDRRGDIICALMLKGLF